MKVQFKGLNKRIHSQLLTLGWDAREAKPFTCYSTEYVVGIV